MNGWLAVIVGVALIALVSPDLRSAGVATRWVAGVAPMALASRASLSSVVATQWRRRKLALRAAVVGRLRPPS
jgi:hypothetical protein